MRHARQGFIQQRTTLINRIRGLLSEFGIVLPLKVETIRRQAYQHLESLEGLANTVMTDLLIELEHLDKRMAQESG